MKSFAGIGTHLRGLGLAFVCICYSSFTVAAEPVFLVKQGDSLGGHVLETVAGSEVSSSLSFANDGTVAFSGWWENGRGVFTQHGLLAGTGDIVAGHRLAWPGSPSINDAGTVAFQSTWDDDGDGWVDGVGIFTQSALLAAEHGTIDGNLIDSLQAFDFPQINSSGEVAFQGSIDEPNACVPPSSCFATGIFTQHRLLVRDGDSVGGLTIEALDEPFKFPAYYFNDAGVAAYAARTDAPGDRWAAVAGDELLYVEGQLIDDRELLALSTPRINDTGDVIVPAGFGDPVSGSIDEWMLLGRNGVRVLGEGDVVDGRVIDTLYGTGGFNNLGEVVFMARYVEQEQSRLGWFTQHRFLADVQVTIDGLEVYLLGLPQINDLGDVVFFAGWDTNGDPRLEGSGIVLLKANNAPVAICADVDTGTDPGRCDARASIDAGSYDPDGDPITLTQSPAEPYPLGATEVLLTVTDSSADVAFCPATVTVTDSERPRLTAVGVAPARLWPPNHQMVPVRVTAVADDNCPEAVSCRIVAIESSEPEDGLGDGNTSVDWQITGDLSADLRAERSGLNDARIYSLSIECADAAGNVAGDSLQVRVEP